MFPINVEFKNTCVINLLLKQGSKKKTHTQLLNYVYTNKSRKRSVIIIIIIIIIDAHILLQFFKVTIAIIFFFNYMKNLNFLFNKF